MVEVSLTEAPTDAIIEGTRTRTEKKKTCWFPFKKQTKNGRTLTVTAGPGLPHNGASNIWDVDELVNENDNMNDNNTNDNNKNINKKSNKKSNKKTNNSSNNNDKNKNNSKTDNKPQRFRKSNTGKKGELVSLSTITDTSMSLLSEVSPTTTATGFSYNDSSRDGDGYDCDYDYDSSSRSKFGFNRNRNAASNININVSYQSDANANDNDNSIIERFTEANYRNNNNYNNNNNNNNNNIRNNNEYGGELEDPHYLIEDFDHDDDGSIVVSNKNHRNGNDNDNDNDNTGMHSQNANTEQQRCGDTLPVPDAKVTAAILDVQTNCISKKFWTDEVVEGGALNCLQERENAVDASTSSNTNGNGNGNYSLDAVERSGAKTAATNGEIDQQPESHRNTSTSTTTPNIVRNPLGRIMRFVSQDPEETNTDGDAAPLRRVLCSAIPPLRNTNQTSTSSNMNMNMNMNMLCRNGEDQNPTILQLWKNQGKRNTHTAREREQPIGDDEEVPNFYVEVEAMREQLDGVRDLEEIQAESDFEFEEDIAAARTASLADADSAFRGSMSSDGELNSNGNTRNTVSNRAFWMPRKQQAHSELLSYNSKRLVQNIISGTKTKTKGKKTKHLEKNDHSAVVVEKRNVSSSRTQPTNSSTNGHRRSTRSTGDSQQEKMDRKNKILSETVTDRVLAMKMENGIISDSRDRDEEFMITQTESKLRGESLKSGSRSRERQIDATNRTLPRIIEPSALSSSLNPLNISELTGSSSNRRVESNTPRTSSIMAKKKQQKNNWPRRKSKSSLRTMQPEDFRDEKKDKGQEQPHIGYFRRPISPSYRSTSATFSPRRDARAPFDGSLPIDDDDRNNSVTHKPQRRGSSSGAVFSPIIDTKIVQSDHKNTKFDENFWKEDTDDLNTEAFEMYGSENGSLFDDINSQQSMQDILFSKNAMDDIFYDPSGMANSKNNVGTNGDHGHGHHTMKYFQAGESATTNTDFPRYSRAGGSSRYGYSRPSKGDSASRTTYLQGDGYSLEN